MTKAETKSNRRRMSRELPPQASRALRVLRRLEGLERRGLVKRHQFDLLSPFASDLKRAMASHEPTEPDFPESLQDEMRAVRIPAAGEAAFPA